MPSIALAKQTVRDSRMILQSWVGRRDKAVVRNGYTTDYPPVVIRETLKENRSPRGPDSMHFAESDSFPVTQMLYVSGH